MIGRVVTFLSLILVFGIGCDPDPILVTEGKFEDGGVFVSCQGLFNMTSGTITHFDPDTKIVSQDIFQEVNAGIELGNIVQSLLVAHPHIYISVNNADKVVVVNSGSFEFEEEINGFNQPRYMTKATDNKLYVSQWGADGSSGSLAIINLDDHMISGEIPLRNGPEKMLVKDGKVYVTNSGGFGRDSVVHVIDVNGDNVLPDIVVGDNPASLVLDKNENIWVLCKGYFDWTNPDNSTSGKLVKIVDDQVALSFDVPNGSDNLSINPERSTLYFTTNTHVIRHLIEDTEFDNEALYEKFFYGLGVDPNSGLIYGVDAKDFSSKGEVFIFEETGILQDSFETGIIPQQIYFE